MKKVSKDCPVCGIQLDDNHFAPVLFPGIDNEICCNCCQNLGLMFTNFDKKPGDNGYIVPDNSYRLEQITGRSYLKNRLLYYENCHRLRKSEKDLANAEVLKELEDELEFLS